MTWLIVASVLLLIGVFAVAIVSGFQQAREMARAVEGDGSTWNENPRGEST